MKPTQRQKNLQRISEMRAKAPDYIETTLEGMKLCVGAWYDTSGGVALAGLYLHLYNESNPANLIDLGQYYNETWPYLEAAFILRGMGKEPHQIGGESSALMEEIKRKYGKKRRSA